METTIEPTEHGHIRTHAITSKIESTAYDCGFALSTDDRRAFECRESGNMAEISNEDGYCMVESLEGEGKGEILVPDPNTNLIHPKTRIPMVVYKIHPGTWKIKTQVNYFGGKIPV